jgi:cell wall-associated NlpC family hydrolase
MSKHILFAATILFLFVGAAVPAQAQKKKHSTSEKKEAKFLEDISVQASNDNPADAKAAFSQSLFKEDKKVVPGLSVDADIENADYVQLKYAQLLDINVEQAVDVNVFKVLDQWMGTRYRLGGSSKDGIDCSAFMQVLFNSIYGISLPRTAREQFDFSQRISRAELKEGDLVFFNTIGGVSHVGMYLQNNKFVHASTGGVTISDLFDDYWMRKFIGVGRVSQDQATASTVKP